MAARELIKAGIARQGEASVGGWRPRCAKLLGFWKQMPLRESAYGAHQVSVRRPDRPYCAGLFCPVNFSAAVAKEMWDLCIERHSGQYQIHQSADPQYLYEQVASKKICLEWFDLAML